MTLLPGDSKLLQIAFAADFQERQNIRIHPNSSGGRQQEKRRAVQNVCCKRSCCGQECPRSGKYTSLSPDAGNMPPRRGSEFVWQPFLQIFRSAGASVFHAAFLGAASRWVWWHCKFEISDLKLGQAGQKGGVQNSKFGVSCGPIRPS